MELLVSVKLFIIFVLVIGYHLSVISIRSKDKELLKVESLERNNGIMGLVAFPVLNYKLNWLPEIKKDSLRKIVQIILILNFHIKFALFPKAILQEVSQLSIRTLFTNLKQIFWYTEANM